MAPTVTITETLIQDAIAAAVQNVCTTMMRQNVKLRPAESRVAGATYHLISNVGFAGEANGLVYLCLSDDFASFATSEILSMSPGEVEMAGFEVVKDAIGEVTNMTAGGFKNKLCDLGFPCKLTLPTLVRGQGLTVADIKGAARFVFEFDCAGHILTADIHLKVD